VEYTETAEADLAEAYEWMRSFGLDVAEGWLAGLTRTLDTEAELMAGGVFRRRLLPDTSAFPGRTVYELLYRTGGRRGSPWHVGYELIDCDSDGVTDTLRVVRIRHAAGGPSSSET
jgi:plasmid stabilization system protein ParE